MKSALPYIGIVVFLMLSSVLISFFLKRDELVLEKETVESQVAPVSESDFPQVGEAERENTQITPSPQPYQKLQQQEEEIIQKGTPRDLLEDLLVQIQKETKLNSFMFKWKTTEDGRLKDVLVSGFQTKFQGTQEDVGKVKDYLRKQSFSADLNNLMSVEGSNLEGFSRDQMVCMIVSSSQNQGLFDTGQGQLEGEIEVNCGKLR